MPTLVIVGAQWGDEAKGKIVDLLCADTDMVVRFTGGNNAGHTVVFGDQLVKFHLIPAGLLHERVRGVITSGTVVCPRTIVQELDNFPGEVTPNRLTISRASHVVLPYHSLLDGAEEDARGDKKIGTTRRGIGPAYSDKIRRTGMRMAEFVDDSRRAERLNELIAEKNVALNRSGVSQLDCATVEAEYGKLAARLRPFVGEAEELVGDAVASGQRVLFEGAHGTLLDIDSGTYPYVTSTHTVAGGACLGTGIGPTQVDNVLGIVKAYTSRVGEGPMPTELFGEAVETLRERGNEYGTTTGRPRRCGWIDLVALRYAARLNGFTSIAVTRLDVLSQYDRLQMCVAYERGGKRVDKYPVDTRALAECKPIFETVDGWGRDLSDYRRFGDLPGAAQRYVETISEALKTPVSMVSVGADREKTIWLDGSRLW